MKVGDMVKRRGWNAVKINGVVLEVQDHPDGRPRGDLTLVLWPNKTTQWIPTHWLVKQTV